MKKYEILEHISDLKIKALGKDKKEAFKNALLGMFGGARYKPISKIKNFTPTPNFGVGASKSKREIKISSSDLQSLLVDFLSEALYLSEINQEVYYDVQFKKFSDKNIEGILSGKKLKRIGVQIKGVTYHGLDIHQKKDKTWEAILLFDI